MTLTLAFRGLAADSPRQRARCSVTGRFVAWVKAAALRVAGAPRVVVVPSTVEPDAADAAPVVAPVTVPPVVAVAAAIAAPVARVARAVAAPVVAVARAAVAPVARAVSSIIARVGRWFRRGGCTV
jgi:phage-related minor tail protein